jgi:hypothetical protein
MQLKVGETMRVSLIRNHEGFTHPGSDSRLLDKITSFESEQAIFGMICRIVANIDPEH